MPTIRSWSEVAPVRESLRPVSGPMLHVETIEARSGRHQWKIDPHIHQVLHQAIFVLRGAGVTMLDGVQAQYRPPVLILIPARTVHGFEFEPGTTGHVISISDPLQRDLVHQEPGIATLFERAQVLLGNALRFAKSQASCAYPAMGNERLLHYTGRAVHTIATEPGFEDAAYFTRFFSRRAGVSPRVFRQRGLENISPQESSQS